MITFVVEFLKINIIYFEFIMVVLERIFELFFIVKQYRVYKVINIIIYLCDYNYKIYLFFNYIKNWVFKKYIYLKIYNFFKEYLIKLFYLDVNFLNYILNIFLFFLFFLVIMYLFWLFGNFYVELNILQ